MDVTRGKKLAVRPGRRSDGMPPVPPFQTFLDEHRTAVYRFLLSSVGPQRVDDSFQETFLAALRAYSKLRDGSSLRSWVLTIATRKAIDAARAEQHRPIASGDMSALAEAASPRAIVPDADGDSQRIEPEDPLWRAVRELPARQRAAVVHRVVLDHSYADIAAAMESSEETARANVYQGLKALRERVER
jgi:RNA polymerase sigma factor (sigma-70 family)